MSNKKTTTDGIEDIQAFMHLMSNPRALASLFGGLMQDPEEKYPYERLGDGYELRPIEILAEGGQFVLDNREKYSHLYHNGSKVTDLIFRKGGTGGKFKDGYCKLIHYTQKEEHTEKRHGFDFGTHVIINHLGDIVLKAPSGLDYPNHIGGHLGSIGNYIYDLRIGKAIAPKSSTTITGKNCIIIEHRYDWYDKEVKLPLGVYQIDYWTAELTKLDDVK
jgi:hypothetical protein